MAAGNASIAPARLFTPFMAYLPGSAWVKDRRGRYVYANRHASEHMFLRAPEAVLGYSDAQLFPAAVAAAFMQNDRQVVETGQCLRCVEILPRDETKRYSLVHKFPILGAGGEVACVGGIAIDITERKQAEDALRGALQEVARLRQRLACENIDLQDEIGTVHGFDGIVGESPVLQQVLDQVDRVARTDVSVLITGETGTGKELFARAVHSRSRRTDRALIKVNCGALSSGVIESELFGHQRGAFTGALRQRTGRFELADGGTIFLDEVGELTPDTQARLLNVLQDGEFEPVGSNLTRRVDVRVIAATNRNMEQQVQGGLFRADLYFRLNVFPIEVPSLRARREDIPLLSRHFLKKSAVRLGKPLRGLTRQSMDQLSAYHWPGNVRELQNVIERAAVLSPGPDVRIDDSRLSVMDGAAQCSETLADVERSHIFRVLQRTGWRVNGEHGAAAILGIHPSTLRSRLKRLGIEMQRRSL